MSTKNDSPLNAPAEAPDKGVVCDALVRLSSADLFVIQHAIECRVKSLEDLHWRAVAMGATEPLYRNIALEIDKNKKAESAICALFEAQFKPNTKFRDAAGQSPALRTDDQPHSL